MKNLYEFAIGLYSEYGDGMDLDSFIDSFISDTFAINAAHEAFADNEFLGCFKMSYKIDHKNKKIKLLFIEK